MRYTKLLLIDQARLKFSNTPGHDMNGVILHLLLLLAHKIVHCTSQTQGKWVHSIFEPRSAPKGMQLRSIQIHSPWAWNALLHQSAALKWRSKQPKHMKHIPLRENYYFCLLKKNLKIWSEKTKRVLFLCINF